jgi:hypothetical protein
MAPLLSCLCGASDPESVLVLNIDPGSPAAGLHAGPRSRSDHCRIKIAGAASEPESVLALFVFGWRLAVRGWWAASSVWRVWSRSPHHATRTTHRAHRAPDANTSTDLRPAGASSPRSSRQAATRGYFLARMLKSTNSLLACLSKQRPSTAHRQLQRLRRDTSCCCADSRGWVIRAGIPGAVAGWAACDSGLEPAISRRRTGEQPAPVGGIMATASTRASSGSVKR